MVVVGGVCVCARAHAWARQRQVKGRANASPSSPPAPSPPSPSCPTLSSWVLGQCPSSFPPALPPPQLLLPVFRCSGEGEPSPVSPGAGRLHSVPCLPDLRKGSSEGLGVSIVRLGGVPLDRLAAFQTRGEIRLGSCTVWAPEGGREGGRPGQRPPGKRLSWGAGRGEPCLELPLRARTGSRHLRTLGMEPKWRPL